MYDTSYVPSTSYIPSFLIIFIVLFYFLAFAFSIASYVLQGLGLMGMAKKLRISNPWLAFLPVGNLFIIGKIAEFDLRPGDKPRKWGRILLLMVGIPVIVLFVLFFIFIIMVPLLAMSQEAGDPSTASFIPLILLLGVMIVDSILLIAACVVEYVCIYKMFKLFVPENAVLLLVLSILLPVTYPFILFFNRNKLPRNPYTGAPIGDGYGYYEGPYYNGY